MTNYCSIGKVVAAFGTDGELVLQHSLGKKTALKGLECLFIEQKKDEFIPYFLESARIKTDESVYVKLEGINSREDARKFIQKQVWLTEPDFKKFALSSSPISMLGFHIVDKDVDLGEILEVIEQPHQILCLILLNGKEALIPVHQDTLLKIDKKNRRVFVDLPDGLLEIFR